MDYSDFKSYPIQIVGIDSDYDDMLNEIKNFILADMNYSGDEADLDSVLPYFVFYNFCQEQQSTVVHSVGETSQTKEFSDISLTKQINAWNIGVAELTLICNEKGTTVDKTELYLSKRTLL